MRSFGLLVGVVLLLVFVVGGTALGVQPPSAAAPAWHVTTATTPSVLQPGLGRHGRYSIVVENIGAATAEGEVTVRDRLPAGISAAGFQSVEPQALGPECPVATGPEIVCRYPAAVVVPSGFLVVNVEFEVTGSVGSLVNVASVSGGGAPTATDETSIRKGAVGEVGPAGVADFRFEATGPAGEPDVRAGGHPHFLTTTLVLNSMRVESLSEQFKPVEAPKDLIFYLPLGVLGDPAVTEPCPASLVQIVGESSGCPASSRVGTVLAMLVNQVFATAPDATFEHGLYSMTPEKGYAAEFAFGSNGLTFFAYASVVRRGGHYMLRVAIPGVPGGAALIGFVATFFGDIEETLTVSEQPFIVDRGAFLTNPSDCQASEEAREASVEVNSWKEPEPMVSRSTLGYSPLQGCELLSFSPYVNVVPQTTQADAPSGYDVDIHVPQAPNRGTGLGTPPVRSVELKLPLGTTISPSSANGLSSCDESGSRGINIDGGESEAVGPDGLEHPVAGRCPKTSELADVTATTPLLREKLTGHLFLATPQCGGSGQAACEEADAENGRLFSLYLELAAPDAGVVVKLKGEARVDRDTGQITAIFGENPEFPFSDLSVAMHTGARAPLANPQSCGQAVSSAVISPWSGSAQLPQDVASSDFFRVDWNGAGGSCPGAVPFSPSLTAGTVSNRAGAFSSFTLTLKREDREQNLASLSTTLPPGLLAAISHVGRCPEPLASEASLTACPANSKVGTTTVAVGSGTEPYYVTGDVYFTGPYGGAPFGLTVVVPAVAGPFNLGDVVVRVALFVDPHTAQVTAVSAPFPQKLDGVPLHLRMVNVTLDAHEFTLNPTSCAQLAIVGQARSTTGAMAGVSSQFAANGCKKLAFKPTVNISTDAKSTKVNGTGVKVKIAYPAAEEANIQRVNLEFPRALPVRLSTLRLACTAATFEANPAACPTGANIGTAVVHTPILAQPLTGPVYLVSYGNAKFPAVVFVLQGEGVTLEVTGQSFVSKSGVLKVTFDSVPDAPFTTFETNLPKGPHSQFTSVKSVGRASASQCGENLLAPLVLTGQNGAQLKEKVKLQITGCGPQRPRVSVRRVVSRSDAVVVTVKTSVKGRVNISGPGLIGLHASVGAGTHTFTVRLTNAGKRVAEHHGKSLLSVRLTAGKQNGASQKRVAL